MECECMRDELRRIHSASARRRQVTSQSVPSFRRRRNHVIRRQMRRTLFVLLTAALGIALPGWAVPSGGTLRVGIDVDAGTLDPRLANDTTARRVIEQVYDGLIELDPQLRPRPPLAESWTQLTPTVWVFKLRQSVHFQDRTPLTAAEPVVTYY